MHNHVWPSFGQKRVRLCLNPHKLSQLNFIQLWFCPLPTRATTRVNYCIILRGSVDFCIVPVSPQSSGHITLLLRNYFPASILCDGEWRLQFRNVRSSLKLKARWFVILFPSGFLLFVRRVSLCGALFYPEQMGLVYYQITATTMIDTYWYHSRQHCLYPNGLLFFSEWREPINLYSRRQDAIKRCSSPFPRR